MRRPVAVLIAAFVANAVLCPAGAARADDIAGQIDGAQAAMGRGDMLRALEALQPAVAALTAKLLEQYAKTLPPVPAGWDAGPPDSQPLDAVSGGLTVTRGYQKGDTALNVSLIIDNPAVANAAQQFQSGGDPGWSHVKVGSEDALLRYDGANHEGEIMIVLQARALLQIEGTEIESAKALTDAAKGWNFAAIRKLLGPS